MYFININKKEGVMSVLVKCHVCGASVSTGARRCRRCGEPDFIRKTVSWENATVVKPTCNTPYRGFMVETESRLIVEFKFYEEGGQYQKFFENVCVLFQKQGFIPYRPGPHLILKIENKDGSACKTLLDYEVISNYRSFFDSL